MTQVQVDAIKKLQDKEQRKGAKSKCATAVYEAVRDMMIYFCEQQEEFADAILQGKTLGECCEEIMKGCGNHISDNDVYTKAAAFYFPGAKVKMTMTIYMSEFECEEKQEEQGASEKPADKFLRFDFKDFFKSGGK